MHILIETSSVLLQSIIESNSYHPLNNCIHSIQKWPMLGLRNLRSADYSSQYKTSKLQTL